MKRKKKDRMGRYSAYRKEKNTDHSAVCFSGSILGFTTASSKHRRKSWRNKHNPFWLSWQKQILGVGQVWKATAEMRKHMWYSQDSASALTTQALLVPDSWPLRCLAASASGLPTFVTAPSFSRDLEHRVSHHNDRMQEEVQDDFSEVNS